MNNFSTNFVCLQSATSPSEGKSALEGDIVANLVNFTKELQRSRRRAEMAANMVNSLIKYHNNFCKETRKSLQRLHNKLQQMQPAEPVSF